MKKQPEITGQTRKNIIRAFCRLEDYLKVLLGTFGCVHFQDRLKTEFLKTSKLTERKDNLQPYVSEFHLTVSLSMYRLWLKRGKDLSTDELASLIHTLYISGSQGVLLD